MNEVIIAPSILSADFAALGRDVAAAEAAGADWIHVDVMDGHFVPNLTIGPGVTRALRSATDLPLDVHLMIEDPERLIPAFVDAGADRITVHQESCRHLHRVVSEISESGCKAGVALNPATPVGSLREIVSYLDLILIMTVNPGFGGQSFIRSMPGKIAETRALIEERGPDRPVLIQVDGGIDPETAPLVVTSGARALVAGSAVYGAEDGPAQSIPRLRSAAEAALPPRIASTESSHGWR